MNRKMFFIIGLLLAATLGSLIPQWIVGHVEGSTNEVTFQFMNLGMNTQEERKHVKEILDHVVGIESYEVDPKVDRVIITFDKETMKPEWIAKSLEVQGYRPEDYRKIK